MWPFNRKSEESSSIAVKGEEVHLNLAPASSTTVVRKLHRMLRLIEHAKKSKLSVEEREKAQHAFRREQLMLTANGIMVPSDDAGILRLIREIETKEV